VFGAIGANGRLLKSPLSYPFRYFPQCAGHSRSPHTKVQGRQLQQLAQLIPAPIPSRRAGAVLVVRLRFWSSLSTGEKRWMMADDACTRSPGCCIVKMG
jgi:hypothetical protein